MNNKKTIIASIIGVALLVLTVVGATFAYFTTVTTNDEGVTNVTGKTDAIGSVALTNPTSNLHITLSALDMAQDNLNTYWATNDSTLNYDSEEVQRDIAVATLSGGEATTHYECSTTINVSISGTMVAGLQIGDAYIQFGGLLTDKVDLTNVSSTGYPVTFALNGTDTLSQSVSAAIAIENRNANQNSIAGKELSVTFSNEDLECKVIEAPAYVPSTEGNAFAIYSEDDNSLRFYKNYDTVQVGDTYRGKTATEVYTGFETGKYYFDNATEEGDYPWESHRWTIETIEFIDVISPVSMQGYFGAMWDLKYLDATNLDTSNVTDMSYALLGLRANTIKGLENWDTSNVTNMMQMFEFAANIPDISNWNVSNVTTMLRMFSMAGAIGVGYSTGYTAENPLDLSGWDVSKVTRYDEFIDEINPAGSIIAPNFGA